MSLFLDLDNDGGSQRNVEEAEEVHSFSCRMENIKLLIDLLSALGIDIHKDQDCLIDATEEALIFMVSGRGKSSQGRVTFLAAIFDQYEISAPSIQFAVKLAVLLDCLKLFGTASETTAATMSYSTQSAVFKLSLEDSGVITICDINTLYLDPLEEEKHDLLMAFRASSEDCNLIVKSEPLRESIHELGDSLWADSVHFEVEPRTSVVKIHAGGAFGSTEIIIPRTSNVFVSFHCTADISFRYPLKSFLLAMKALSVAKETNLRLNGRGLMCVQHQIETNKGQDAFFDFFMVPEETLDDEEE